MNCFALASLLPVLLLGAKPFSATASPSSSPLSIGFDAAKYNVGDYVKGTVKLDAAEEIVALAFKVYFPGDYVTAERVENRVEDAVLSDYNVATDYVSFSCIFAQNSGFSKKDVLFINFQITGEPPLGNCTFDVVVEEAFGADYAPLDVAGSRSSVQVWDSGVHHTAIGVIFNQDDVLSLQCGDVFRITVWYVQRGSSFVFASGAFSIQYDRDLLECLSYEGGLVASSLSDVSVNNANGEVLVSFVNYASNPGTVLVDLAFKVKGNAEVETSIEIHSSDLFDEDLNPVAFSSSPARYSLHYSPERDESLASLRLTGSQSDDLLTTELVLRLSADSHLGAADLVIRYDPSVHEYLSFAKNQSVSFLNLNLKQVDEGVIRVSVISLEDLMEGMDLVTFRFRPISSGDASFEIEGSGITDSLTNPLTLPLFGTAISVSAHPIIEWGNEYLHMRDASFDGEGSGRCVRDSLYSLAKSELLSMDPSMIEALNQNDVFESTLDRYLAWARANGDSRPFEDVPWVNALSNVIMDFGSNKGIEGVQVLLSLLGVIGLGAFCLLLCTRRKRGS